MENRKLLYNGREIEVMPYINIEDVDEKYKIVIDIIIFPFTNKSIIEDTVNLRYVNRIYFYKNLLRNKKVLVEKISSKEYGFMNCDVVIAFDNILDMIKYKLTC